MDLSPEVTVKRFKKFCVSNAMDGREDEEKLRMLAKKLMKLEMWRMKVVKLGTVKTVRPTGETEERLQAS
jgi:hypothetical protein